MLYDEATMNKVLCVQRVIDKKLTIQEAVDYLKMSERTVWRYVRKYREHWPPWLIHGLKNRPSNNRKKKREGIEKYARQKRYEWFGPTLLSEKLEEKLWYTVPIESLRRMMTQWWLWKPKKSKQIKWSPRQRRDGYGMMIQFDGSYHDWLEDGWERCMLLWIDDATGRYMHCMFTKWEGIDEVIEYWNEYFERYWKPSIIYLDRHASYKVNHRKDQFDHETKTRFLRGMQRLDIQVIYARSPQAKWRIERGFGTMQDRGIKEMRLAGVKTYEEATAYMNEVLIPKLNEKFSKQAKTPWDFHVSMTEYDEKQLERYFALRTKRKINKIGVVRYKNKKYHILKWQTLNGTRNVTVLESNYWGIQIWNWELKLDYEQIRYY